MVKNRTNGNGANLGFEEKNQFLIRESVLGADPEDPDKYRAENVFWVPKEARWEHLKNNAKQPTIGKIIDEAMDAVERDNPSLKGVLFSMNYARPALDKQRLGWKFGVPPTGNANFAWVQHFIHHLSPSGEGEIRKTIIEADLVDCMVALPSQLFYNTMIPACLWFVARDKKNHKFRDRRGEVLFIDARKMGVLAQFFDSLKITRYKEEGDCWKF